MGEKRKVEKIATLGRANTNEFVTEYIVQYSDDGELWRSYVSPGGEVQVNVRIKRFMLLCVASIAFGLAFRFDVVFIFIFYFYFHK